MSKVNKTISGINFADEAYPVRLTGRSWLICNENQLVKK
jgi:hypothetical protein